MVKVLAFYPRSAVLLMKSTMHVVVVKPPAKTKIQCATRDVTRVASALRDMCVMVKVPAFYPRSAQRKHRNVLLVKSTMPVVVVKPPAKTKIQCCATGDVIRVASALKGRCVMVKMVLVF